MTTPPNPIFETSRIFGCQGSVGALSPFWSAYTIREATEQGAQAEAAQLSCGGGRSYRLVDFRKQAVNGKVCRNAPPLSPGDGPRKQSSLPTLGTALQR